MNSADCSRALVPTRATGGYFGDHPLGVFIQSPLLRLSPQRRKQLNDFEHDFEIGMKYYKDAREQCDNREQLKAAFRNLNKNGGVFLEVANESGVVWAREFRDMERDVLINVVRGFPSVMFISEAIRGIQNLTPSNKTHLNQCQAKTQFGRIEKDFWDAADYNLEGWSMQSILVSLMLLALFCDYDKGLGQVVRYFDEPELEEFLKNFMGAFVAPLYCWTN
jgi:hypothetical protein